ncbi:hypothetical protein JK228_19900, partial [Serratia rubidaea]|nr:hypothetical protein [Serratia rubidaea]
LAWDAAGVEASDLWRVAIGNYGDAPSLPQPLTLRPFEAVWWLLEA